MDDLTYTTTGPYGNGDYLLRITPDGQPNAGTSITIANGGGSHDDRTVVDPSFLELVRLGVKSPSAADITNTISAVDSELEVSTPEGPIWHRYNFDGYGETSSGGDYTGSGVGNPWPVLTGERGEYDVADGNLSGAQSMLATMQGAANAGYQISEQVWGGSTGTGGFTFGQADNSSTPLMWAMAQYVRLAIDISAGKDVDTPAVVYSCLQQSSCPVTGTVKETVNVTVPVNTDASEDTVYLDGNLSALGYGAVRLGLERHRDDPRQFRRMDHDRLRDRGHDAVLQVRPGRQLEQRGGDRRLRFGQQPLDVRQRRHGERHGGQLGGPQCLR